MVEQLGFDSFWLRDHPARAPEDPFTFLAAVAVVTHRVRLGTLVAGAHYRTHCSWPVWLLADAETARLLAERVVPEVQSV